MESRQSLEGIGSIHVGSRNVGSNEEYDPATNTWRECARMPRGLNHIGAVGLGGKVFLHWRLYRTKPDRRTGRVRLRS